MRPYIIRINGGLVLLYFLSSSGLGWKEWIGEIVWPWEGEDACSKGASDGSKISGSLLFQETWRSICGWSYLTRYSIDQSTVKIPLMKKTAWWLSLLWKYHAISLFMKLKPKPSVFLVSVFGLEFVTPFFVNSGGPLSIANFNCNCGSKSLQ